MEIDNTQPYQPTRKPTFLVVLVVLSFISIGLTLIQQFFALMTGPMSEERMEVYQAEVYESIAQLRDAEMDGMVTMMEKVLAMSIYANDEVYYLNNVLTLLAAILGAIGVLMMLQLKKIGFHLYIIYSLSPVLILYALFPIAAIPTIVVVMSLFLGALFSVLYGLNLKHMK
jgi:hypothetical protein